MPTAPRKPKVSPTPARRIRARSSDPERPSTAVEERLLLAIERLLGSGTSFAALSVDQLAREAGIGRATFYLHFKDKAQLVHRLMRKLTAEVVDGAGAWFRDGGEVDRRSMHLALHGIVGTFKRHQAVLSAIAATAPSDPAVAEAHTQMMDELCRLSRKAIAQVRRKGQATAAATPELADLLTWSIELYCTRFVSGYDGKRVNALIDLIAHVCGRAIFADEAQ
jgi:TetR/AcrR family transcriptional regulator, ethionamide resistance regulator